MATSEKIVLIDGNSLAYRAFFVFPDFATAGGTPTGAVFGFLRMLFKLLEDEKPDYLVVAFDVKGPTFRDEMYADYKGHRPPAPDAFRPQLPLLRQALEALRIAYVELPGFEADDVIGTLALRAAEQGIEARIVTGDRDALQLVGDRVRVLLTRKGITEIEEYDAAAVRARYGLEPSQMVDLKGLMGDSSDNIPGVRGVGEKTAIKLLQQFGNIEAVLDRVGEVAGNKLRETLVQHAGDARLSKRLAAIDTAAPIAVELAQLRIQEPDWPAAQALFRQLELKSLLAKVTPPQAAGDPQAARPTAAGPTADDPTAAGPTAADPTAAGAAAQPVGDPQATAAPAPIAVANEADARALAPRLPPAAAIAVAMAAIKAPPLPPGGRWQPAGAALHDPDGDAAYWFPATALPSLDDYWPRATGLTGFDLKPLLVWLYRRGVRPAPPAFDGALAAYLLDPSRSSYRLADWARQHQLGEVPDGDEPAALAAAAAVLTGLRGRLLARLRDAGLEKLFTVVEMPLLPILAEMEATGIAVDKAQLEAIGSELEGRIQAIQQEIWAECGRQFNLNSPKQLADVLFGQLGLPVLKRTKTGPSTDAEVLEELAAQAPVVARILDYRTLVKLKGTYVDGLGPLVEPDGRIHTTFGQTVAATGRLSSSDPNLQNIPIRVEEGRRLRKAFVPGEAGWVLFAADYSQIELRVVAHYSGDRSLVEAFIRDEDIHTRTAAQVFGLPMNQVDRDQRRAAKAVNFGLIYGQSDFGLARALGIGRSEARAFIERYFATYPGVKRYMDGKVAEAREKGYVTTLLGRRRFLPEIHARNYAVRQNAERAAINTPIQGTAADLMKLAMVAVHRDLKASGLQARLLLQVHDELVFECPADEVPALRDLVCPRMEQALQLNVPLKVEAKVGPNWYDLRPVGAGSAVAGGPAVGGAEGGPAGDSAAGDSAADGPAGEGR